MTPGGGPAMGHGPAGGGGGAVMTSPMPYSGPVTELPPAPAPGMTPNQPLAPGTVVLDPQPAGAVTPPVVPPTAPAPAPQPRGPGRESAPVRGGELRRAGRRGRPLGVRAARGPRPGVGAAGVRGPARDPQAVIGVP